MMFTNCCKQRIDIGHIESFKFLQERIRCPYALYWKPLSAQFSSQVIAAGFDHVFTAQDIGSYKPSATNFEHLIGNSPVPKDEILHVAQSQYHDVAPAAKMGLQTVWVNRRGGDPGHGATPPADALADLEVPDLKSLAALVVKACAP